MQYALTGMAAQFVLMTNFMVLIIDQDKRFRIK